MPIITLKTYRNGELVKVISKEVSQNHVDRVNYFFDDLSKRKKIIEKKIEEKFKNAS
jgi:hypothetical protein